MSYQNGQWNHALSSDGIRIQDNTIGIGQGVNHTRLDDYKDEVNDPYILINDHAVKPSSDFDSFECRVCNTEFEVPDIVKAGPDFQNVVYQLYVFSHFKKNDCPGFSYPEDKSKHSYNPGTFYDKLHGNTTTSKSSGIKKGDKVYETRGGRDVVLFDDTYSGKVWTLGGDGPFLTEEVVKNLPYADADRFLNAIGQPSTPSTSTYSDIDISTPDGTPKDPLDTSDDGTTDLSAKEKFAKKLLDQY